VTAPPPAAMPSTAQVQPAPRPPESRPTPAPAPVPAPQGPQTTEEFSIGIRRGMPRTAESIARLINQTSGKNLTRMDIMGLFGEKSYLLAELGGRVVGLVGFQVENLITRVDEFIILPDAPVGPISDALIQSVEEASKILQSEVGFVYLPLNTPSAIIQAFLGNNYERTELDSIKVPAWREAAAESQPPNTSILAKKLRAERVLKPL
jgi:hypothetical protein